MLVLVIGAVNAVEVGNVSSTEDSNLISDSVSDQKLEISSEDSISQTNIVNSHDDNLSDYPLESVDASNYEDNDGEINTSIVDDSSILSSTNDDVLSAKKTATKLTVSSTHYSSSGSLFEVTLKNAKGKALTNQKEITKACTGLYGAVQAFLLLRGREIRPPTNLRRIEIWRTVSADNALPA